MDTNCNLKENIYMSNEEINILINIHIEELEKDNPEDNPCKRRLIKALKQATEIISKK